MIVSLKPMVILLQETMMEGMKAKESLEPWLKEWSFHILARMDIHRDW